MFVIMIIFPIISMTTARLIKDLLKLIQENKELLETIKNILQALPDGVVINVLDPKTKKNILKFTNKSARQQLFGSNKDRNESISLDN